MASNAGVLVRDVCAIISCIVVVIYICGRRRRHVSNTQVKRSRLAASRISAGMGPGTPGFLPSHTSMLIEFSCIT